MSSPAKKRKLNSNGGKSTASPSKGLEYFFSKQKQNEGSNSSVPAANKAPSDVSVMLADEELARKLQAEWDAESASDPRNGPESGLINGDSKTVQRSSQPETAGPEPKPAASAATLSQPDSHSRSSASTLTLQSTGISEDFVTMSIPFDESPLVFEPAKYVAQLQEHWKAEGGNASYALLTRCFVLVSGTTSRIKIVDTLVNCLRVLIEGDASSLLPAVSNAVFFYSVS